MKVEFNRIDNHGQNLMPCPLCAAPAQMWEMLDENQSVKKFACCSVTVYFGPLDDFAIEIDEGEKGDGCPLNNPDRRFYRSRYTEAARTWNDNALYCIMQRTKP